MAAFHRSRDSVASSSFHRILLDAMSWESAKNFSPVGQQFRQTFQLSPNRPTGRSPHSRTFENEYEPKGSRAPTSRELRHMERHSSRQQLSPYPAGVRSSSGFGNYYGGAHVGRDTAGGLGPGMVPTADAARGEAFSN